MKYLPALSLALAGVISMLQIFEVAGAPTPRQKRSSSQVGAAANLHGAVVRRYAPPDKHGLSPADSDDSYSDIASPSAPKNVKTESTGGSPDTEPSCGIELGWWENMETRGQAQQTMRLCSQCECNHGVLSGCPLDSLMHYHKESFRGPDPEAASLEPEMMQHVANNICNGGFDTPNAVPRRLHIHCACGQLKSRYLQTDMAQGLRGVPFQYNDKDKLLVAAVSKTECTLIQTNHDAKAADKLKRCEEYCGCNTGLPSNLYCLSSAHNDVGPFKNAPALNSFCTDETKVKCVCPPNHGRILFDDALGRVAAGEASASSQAIASNTGAGTSAASRSDPMDLDRSSSPSPPGRSQMEIDRPDIGN